MCWVRDRGHFEIVGITYKHITVCRSGNLYVTVCNNAHDLDNCRRPRSRTSGLSRLWAFLWPVVCVYATRRYSTLEYCTILPLPCQSADIGPLADLKSGLFRDASSLGLHLRSRSMSVRQPAIAHHSTRTHAVAADFCWFCSWSSQHTLVRFRPQVRK